MSDKFANRILNAAEQPTVLSGVHSGGAHESVLQAFHVLAIVRDWLEAGVPSEQMLEMIDAIRELSKWLKPDPVPVLLDRVRPGSVFETLQGVRAVKSEYHYDNGGAPQCILLASGEYAHFTLGGKEWVRVVWGPSQWDTEATE